MRTILTILCLVAVGLAGCTEGEPEVVTVDNVDPDEFVLEEGKGAIAGILVDDRFRPIELTDNPQTEFQQEGFILLQETGQRAQTGPNGEFTFVDLEPGSYTLRATVAGHEATPAKTEVEEGLFAEANVLARRIVGSTGFVISYEYAAFSSCGFNVIIIGTPWDCTFDMSGDSDRPAFSVDYSSYNATHFIMEMWGNNPNYFDVWARPSGQTSTSQAYQILGGPETQYLRWHLRLNETSMHDEGASGRGGEGKPWLNDVPVQTVIYLNSPGFEQEFPAELPILGTHWLGFGVGAYLGVQGNFVQNVFVGPPPPDVDIETFCVLCP